MQKWYYIAFIHATNTVSMRANVHTAILNNITLLIIAVAYSYSNTAKAQQHENNGQSMEIVNNESLKGYSQKFMEQSSFGFLENRGQLINSEYKDAPKVLFEAQAPGLNIYITNKGLSYIFLTAAKQNSNSTNPMENRLQEDNIDRRNTETKYCRIDMALLGANIKSENIIKEYPCKADYNFFYGNACPQGLYGVKKYNKITIKEIYPGIDWVIFTTNGKETIEYDFIVNPGANPDQIKLEYTGAGDVNKEGTNKLIVNTELGNITEGELFTYYQQTKREIKSQYRIENTFHSRNENEANIKTKLVTFDLGDYDKTKPLVIDPKLVWATYYGGNSLEKFLSINSDKSGNVFVTGYIVGTSALFPLLNPGLPTYYQGTMTASSVYVIILKFDKTGVLKWATYYGGDTNIQNSGIGADNEGYSITTDNTGNVYVTGVTTANNFPLKIWAGAYNQTLNATTATQGDAFILKFDNTGTLLWSTCFGGDQHDRGYGIKIDPAGNIILMGQTYSSSGFPLKSNGGAYFQNVYGGTFGGGCGFCDGDLFVAKFNSSGVHLWGTYYGGNSGDFPYDMDVDSWGNIFIVGWIAKINVGVTTFPVFNPGGGAYFYASYTGPANYNGFIIEFDNSGILKWSTLVVDPVGGRLTWANSVVADKLGNIFVNCIGDGTYPFTNPGGGAYYKTVLWTGSSPIFKFNTTRQVVWCTRFGATLSSNSVSAFGADLAVDECNNVYLFGYTDRSTNLLPTTPNSGCGSFIQNDFGILFLSMFSNNGNLLWMTRYENNPPAATTLPALPAHSIAFDETSKSIYLAAAFGNSGIMTVDPGGGAYYDNTWNSTSGFGTIEDGGIIKFTHIKPDLTLSSTPTSCSCTGSATSSATCGIPPYIYNWSNGANTANLTGLCAGTYSLVITDATCLTDTAYVTLTGNGIAATINSVNTTCSTNNGSATANPTSGTAPYTYNWSNGQTTQTSTGLSGGNYTVTVTDQTGCSITKTTSVTSQNNLTGQFTKGTANCNGCGCKEWIIVTATGGTSPYSYFWPDGYANRYKHQLCPGTYTINITDKNGCIANIAITAP